MVRLAHAHDTALCGCHRTADDWGFALIGEFYVDQPWRRAARACGLPAEQVENPPFQTLDGLGEHAVKTHGLSADEPGLVADPAPAAHRMRLLLAAGGLA